MLRSRLRELALAWTSLRRDESGATAVEYALICSLITIAVVAAFSVFIPSLTALYDGIADHFAEIGWG
ncbi:pilus assembly protein Flp/PilA [Rhodopseudomonas julia]|uniref:Pilus assembly protein Flp/PilA n=1 Tax=Rhodopseudomonas julia TaxID=200617 RepID=A0ABU0CA25_9BRAD|nr:Flp family type IVb pilin [Rhodopseudomonas julia]MDQ0325927.1 pilus assembly protein Flp/PilA [Rhodopseudomonas julia]